METGSWHSDLQFGVSYPKAHSWTAIWSQSSSKCLVYASSSRTYSDTHIPNTGKLGTVEMGGNSMHDIISSALSHMQVWGNTEIYGNLTWYRLQILLQSSRPLERSDGYDFPNMVTSHPGVKAAFHTASLENFTFSIIIWMFSKWSNLAETNLCRRNWLFRGFHVTNSNQFLQNPQSS